MNALIIFLLVPAFLMLKVRWEPKQNVPSVQGYLIYIPMNNLCKHTVRRSVLRVGMIERNECCYWMSVLFFKLKLKYWCNNLMIFLFFSLPTVSSNRSNINGVSPRQRRILPSSTQISHSLLPAPRNTIIAKSNWELSERSAAT